MSSEEWAGRAPVLPTALQECVASAIGSHGLLLCRIMREHLACCMRLRSCKAGMCLEGGHNISTRAWGAALRLWVCLQRAWHGLPRPRRKCLLGYCSCYNSYPTAGARLSGADLALYAGSRHNNIRGVPMAVYNQQYCGLQGRQVYRAGLTSCAGAHRIAGAGLPRPEQPEIVLLTGATDLLGRFLLLETLQRMAAE